MKKITNKIAVIPVRIKRESKASVVNRFLLTIRRNDKTIIGNKKGYLLPMVIIYMIIAAIVGFGILVLGSLERIDANKRLCREQAFYLAEAGINYARFQLKASSSWVPSPNPMTINLGNGSFQLQEAVNGNTVLVTVTGTVKGVTERTALTVTKNGTFSQGIFGSGDVYLQNNALIDSFDSRLGPYGGSNIGSNGDVASNTQITVNNNAEIHGNATGGNISDYSNGISGTKTTNASNRTLPPVVIPSDLTSLSYPVQGDARITGNYTLSNGTFTANGNVTITGGNFHFKNFNLNNNIIVSISSDFRFYVENNFSLNNGSDLTLPGGELYIGTSGTITMDNNSSIQNSGTAADFGIYVASANDQTFENNSSAFSAAIYAPLATINFSNNSGFCGGIVAKEVILGNNTEIHYDVALQSVNPPGSPDSDNGITFIGWTKPDWKR